jgi:hypothetical protein
MRLVNRLFQPATYEESLTLRFAALGLCAFANLIFWYWFLSGGKLTLNFEDWPKEASYLDLLRESIRNHIFPFHSIPEIQLTQRFLGVPETMLWPHLLLLRWQSNQQFILSHVILISTLGIFGCWRLSEKLGWSVFSFCALVLVTFFNGFIVSRIAVGHFMWCGYFLFSWVFIGALNIAQSPESIRARIEFAWVIFAMFLLGSFHLATWWLLFLCFFVLAKPSLLKSFFYALSLAICLCLFRIVPAVVAYGHLHRDFGTGFPNLTCLLQAFVQPYGYDHPRIGGTELNLGWWEFNHYIGLGAALGLGALLLWRSDQGQHASLKKQMLIAAVLLAVFSLSNFYRPIASLPFPLLNGERITTRFIAVSFFVLAILALDKSHRMPLTNRPLYQMLALVILLQTAFELCSHAGLWRLASLEATYPDNPFAYHGVGPSALPTILPHELKYKLSVIVSWMISGVGLLVSILVWVRKTQPAQAAIN